MKSIITFYHYDTNTKKIHLNTYMIYLLKRKKVIKLRKWSFNFSHLKTFIFIWTLLLQVNALFMNVVGTLPIQCISCWVVFFHSFWFEFNRVCVNCSFIHLLLWQSKPHPFFQAIHQTDQAVTMFYLHLVNSNNICSIFSEFSAHSVYMMKNI